jgi:hypothetical protein
MERAQKTGMLLCERIFVPNGPKIGAPAAFERTPGFCALKETGQVKKSGGKKSDRKKRPDETGASGERAHHQSTSPKEQQRSNLGLPGTGRGDFCGAKSGV